MMQEPFEEHLFDKNSEDDRFTEKEKKPTNSHTKAGKTLESVPQASKASAITWPTMSSPRDAALGFSKEEKFIAIINNDKNK